MGVRDLFKCGKWVLITGVVGIVAGFGVFLHAWDAKETTKAREIMAVTVASSMPNVAIPPIDRSVAVKTETATFGLG